MKLNTSPLLIDFLEHIQTELDFIIKTTEGLRAEDFLDDELRTRAVIRSLEIIGEASKNIPTDFRDGHPDVDWRGFTGIRDRLIHKYWKVDESILWEAVQIDVPVNKQYIDRIIVNMKQESDKL